jgi:hypothetical protein
MEVVMQVWVVFADRADKRDCNEDLICHSAAECKAHMKDLREIGCEPIFTIYESEEVWYAIKEARD